MPRPTKAFRRMKVNAAAAWKRGERTEAHGLWEKAAAGYKEHQAKKKNKKKSETESAGAGGEAGSS